MGRIKGGGRGGGGLNTGGISPRIKKCSPPGLSWKTSQPLLRPSSELTSLFDEVFNELWDGFLMVFEVISR